MRSSDWRSDVCSSDLDLADQVQRRLQGLRAFLPLGRADLARMRGHVLRGLALAQRFQRVAADALGGDLDGLDRSLRVDELEAGGGQAARWQDIEVVGDRECRVTEPRDLYRARRN